MEYTDELHDEIASGENRANQESSQEFSEDYDWGKYDFENDPDWR